MEQKQLILLAEEAHGAAAGLTEALTHDCPGCVTSLSEANRRAMSALCDLQAYLFSAFLPELPRAAAGRLGAALTDVVFAAFSASLLLPPRTCAVALRDTAALSSLLAMSEHIHAILLTLPRYAKGKRPAPPDTYRYLAERNKWGAARAVTRLHGGIAAAPLAEALDRLAAALDQAREATVALLMESI